MQHHSRVQCNTGLHLKIDFTNNDDAYNNDNDDDNDDDDRDQVKLINWTAGV